MREFKLKKSQILNFLGCKNHNFTRANFLTQLILILIFLSCSKGFDKEQEQEKFFNIGDHGQAGIIFYDKGEYTDGWRYIEVAPVSSEFTATWGGINQYVEETHRAVGTGGSNTIFLLKYVESVGDTTSSAFPCNSINIDGYQDWYIPSRDELMFMYLSLKKQGIAEFRNDTYWSSTQYNEDHAWLQYFGNGRQYHAYKGNVIRVRAIRYF